MKYLRNLIETQRGQIRSIESSIVFRLGIMESNEVHKEQLFDELKYLCLEQITLISNYVNANKTLWLFSAGSNAREEIYLNENILLFKYAGNIIRYEDDDFSKENLARIKINEEIKKLTESISANPEVIFDCICDLLDYISASYFIDGISNTIGQLTHHLNETIKKLSSFDKKILEDSILNYLSRNWIYLTLKDENNQLINHQHQPLIDLIETLQENNVRDLQIDHNLSMAIETAELNSELKQSLNNVLRKIEDLVGQDGVSVFDIFSENSPFLGRYDGNIMVIPGDHQIDCKDILIGISGTKSRGRSSPKEVMTSIRETLVHCPNVKVCVFISDMKGMGSVLEDNLGLFDAYMKKGNLRYFFPIVVVRRRLTLVNWK
jgi:hypothetical protein